MDVKRIVVMLAIASTLIACANVPPVERFVAVLDGFSVPPRWTLAKAVVRGPDSTFIVCTGFSNNDCPSVHRFYWVEGALGPHFADAKAMLLEAGFLVTDEVNPGCVASNDPIVACYLRATKGLDGITVYLSDPGIDREELGIADPGKSIIELRAYPLPEKKST